MTQEEKKELLLKDLSTRLPYGVHIHSYCQFDQNSVSPLYSLRERKGEIRINDVYYIDEVKPYLFPLSSMTEEQKNECFKGTPLELDKYGDIAAKCDFYGGCQYADLKIYLEVIVWLLKNHFDIYGLIPMGLADDATGLNIY